MLNFFLTKSYIVLTFVFIFKKSICLYIIIIIIKNYNQSRLCNTAQGQNVTLRKKRGTSFFFWQVNEEVVINKWYKCIVEYNNLNDMDTILIWGKIEINLVRFYWKSKSHLSWKLLYLLNWHLLWNGEVIFTIFF